MQSPFMYESTEGTIDLQYYLSLLLNVVTKYSKFVLPVTVIALGCAYYHVQSIIPTYTSSLTLHLASKEGGYDDSYDGWGNYNFQSTQIGILKSKRLMSRVADWLSEQAGLELAARDLQGAVEITPFGQRDYSDLLIIRTTWEDAEVAAQIANQIAASYIQLMFDQEVDYVLRNQNFLSQRLAVLRAELQQAETLLQDFKESQDILDSSSGKEEAQDELNSMASRYYEARENKLKLADLYEQVRVIDGSLDGIENIPAIANHARVSRTRDTIFELEKKQNELGKRYGPRHNKMIALDAEYQSARAALKQQISYVVKGIEADYQFATKNENSLALTLESVRGKKQSFGRSLGRKDFQLKDLQQDVDTKRDVYSLFLERLNQADASGAMQNGNIWVVDPASAGGRNAGLGLIIYFATALVVLLLGYGAGVIFELFRNVLSSEEDVENNLDVRSLGLLPLIKHSADQSEEASSNDAGESSLEANGNPVLNDYIHNPTSHFAESIRSVRTTLTLSAMGKPVKRYMITSTEQGEGKTSLALSLSASFGQMKNVLLVDCDMRRPSVEKVFSGTEQRVLGLSDVLAGATDVKDCLVQYPESQVSFLCAGSRTLSPLELLSSPEFTLLLNRLSDEFDIVILDTPPCLAVSDAYVVASQVDSILFVVKSEDTKVPSIRKVLSRFDAMGISLTGILLNQVDFDSALKYRYEGNRQYYRTYRDEQPASDVKMLRERLRDHVSGRAK